MRAVADRRRRDQLEVLGRGLGGDGVGFQVQVLGGNLLLVRGLGLEIVVRGVVLLLQRTRRGREVSWGRTRGGRYGE